MSRRKTNKTGRGVSALSSFVALERYLLNSAAWRDLSAIARAAYLEVASGYDGKNNGRIIVATSGLGERLNCNKSTAARALAELADHGFIECIKKGGFVCKVRHASEWRLTAFKCDVSGTLPLKPFMSWQPKVQKSVALVRPYGGMGATGRGKKPVKDVPQWHGRNREGHFQGVHGGMGATLLYSAIPTAASSTTDSLVEGAAIQRAGDLQPQLRTHTELEGLKPLRDILDLSKVTLQKNWPQSEAA